MVEVKEIGSEFDRMPFENGRGLVYPFSPILTFSGRTAIETVLRNIPKVKKAMLPAYCCDSMIEPFRQAGIPVQFYDVQFSDGLKIVVDIPKDVDVLLWCNYFGFTTPMPDLTDFIHRGGIVIEDITHSFLSAQPYHSISHYLVASIRKWEPINCGGYCASVNSPLQQLPRIAPPEEFIALKESAMKIKTQYLEDMDETKKTQYLSMFNISNSWVADNYSELSIDSYSKAYIACVDQEKQRAIRRRNAHILYEGLKDKVEFLFAEEDMDCPLFVPVVFHKDRNEIRQDLAKNKIYCPIHWPHPKAECESNLYDTELSLICDQRYKEEDMMRLVSVFRILL